jgi:pyridoxine 5-phosphate synthase
LALFYHKASKYVIILSKKGDFMKLGVNIDHIAVLREARGVNNPNLIEALHICQIAGADQITLHLREDRRHIQDKDVKDIIEHSSLPINLECAIEPSIIEIVANLKPHRATLVPEKREEVTTEGGLDLNLNNQKLLDAIKILQKNQIEVSLFIEPDIKTIKKAKKLGAEWIELHTGKFSNIWAMLYSNLPKTPHSIKELQQDRDKLKKMLKKEIKKINESAKFAKKNKLKVAAGHGLNYDNIKNLKLKHIQELNIGQSIVARSIFTGLERAIKDMKELINETRCN